jgi:hypothetical protein
MTQHKYGQTSPAYLIHPVDTPASKVIEERPSRVPTFKTDVLAATAVFGFITFAAFYSFYTHFPPGVWTAVITLIFFTVRVSKIFDAPIAHFKETVFQDVTPRLAPPPRTAPLSVNGQARGDVEITRNSKRLRGPLGEIELSGRQLDRLQLLMDDSDFDGRLRRQTSGAGRGVYDIGITTAQYPIFEAALKDRNYIDNDNVWTDSGREWVARK